MPGLPDAAIVIPARYASSRYPGKPLVPIRGADGSARTLIERSYAAASAVAGVGSVHVATDDDRIADAARAFGAAVIMTPESCANGTERVATAAASIPGQADIIINFQGDALLTPPSFVEALIGHMRARPECGTATAAIRCTPGTYAHLLADQAAGRSGGTTVVRDSAGRALYFSKRVIPFISPGRETEASRVLLHLGLYAYRREALARYVQAAPSDTEMLEGLEQLRFLHHGVPIDVVVCEAPGWDMVELNNPTDLEIIESILAARRVV